MAELVHDLAPEARLALVGYRTPDQFQEAVAWIVAQGIPIVSHSNSFLTPPFDGTGPAAARGRRGRRGGGAVAELGGQLRPAPLARARAGGGGRHPDRAGAGDTAAVQPLLGLGRRPRERRGREPRRGRARGSRSSAAPPPARRTSATTPLTAGAGSWRLVVRQEAGPPAELTLFSQTVGFGHARGGPGERPHARATRRARSPVGAVKWTGTALEPYSSQGPTDDGRAKPDLVGPTYVTSNPEWPGTAGTSAATAHLAGAAALLRQARIAAGLPAGPADLRAAP